MPPAIAAYVGSKPARLFQLISNGAIPFYYLAFLRSVPLPPSPPLPSPPQLAFLSLNEVTGLMRLKRAALSLLYPLPPLPPGIPVPTGVQAWMRFHQADAPQAGRPCSYLILPPLAIWHFCPFR